MAIERRGQIWLVDLGYVAKVRPALVLSVLARDDERALLTLVPHTTSPRGTRFEVTSNERFLKAGVFDAQNLVTIPEAKLIRRLGVLSTDCFSEIVVVVESWLGFRETS